MATAGGKNGFPPDAARGNFRRKFRVQSRPRASRRFSSIFILGRWLPARSQSGLPISSNKHRFVSRWKVLIRESPFACNSATPMRRRLTVKIPPCSRKNKSTFVSTVCDLVPSTGLSTTCRWQEESYAFSYRYISRPDLLIFMKVIGSILYPTFFASSGTLIPYFSRYKINP